MRKETRTSYFWYPMQTWPVFAVENQELGINIKGSFVSVTFRIRPVVKWLEAEISVRYTDDQRKTNVGSEATLLEKIVEEQGLDCEETRNIIKQVAGYDARDLVIRFNRKPGEPVSTTIMKLYVAMMERLQVRDWRRTVAGPDVHRRDYVMIGGETKEFGRYLAEKFYLKTKK